MAEDLNTSEVDELRSASWSSTLRRLSRNAGLFLLVAFGGLNALSWLGEPVDGFGPQIESPLGRECTLIALPKGVVDGFWDDDGVCVTEVEHSQD